MPSWINVVPVELPGRGMRMGEPYIENYHDLVTQIIADVECRLPARWALFGHSMGALLAFGLVSRLREKKLPLPAILFVSASSAPSCRNVDRIPDTNNDSALIEDLRRQGGTPRELFESPELLELTLNTLRSDYRVCQSYRHVHSDPFSFPITVFAGCQDDIEIHQVEAWRAEAGADFDLHWFKGGHFFIKDKEADVLRVMENKLMEFV